MKITYTYDGSTANDEWEKTGIHCPFCGSYPSVYRQVTGDRNIFDEDNCGMCLVCVECQSSFHLPEYYARGEPGSGRYARYIDNRIIKPLVAALLAAEAK